MSKCEWNIELLCNGRKLVEGDLDKLHTIGEGMVKCRQWDVTGYLVLNITRSLTERKDSTDGS